MISSTGLVNLKVLDQFVKIVYLNILLIVKKVKKEEVKIDATADHSQESKNKPLIGIKRVLR